MQIAHNAIAERHPEAFPPTVHNFFRLVQINMREISRAFLNGTFESIFNLTPAFHDIAQNHIEREECTMLLSLSSFLIRLKLFWLQGFQVQTSMTMLTSISEIFLAMQDLVFSRFSRYNVLFEKSLLESFQFFSQNQNLVLVPKQSLSLNPHEGFLESFKIAGPRHQKLTFESCNRYLNLLSGGAYVQNLQTSSINGSTTFLPPRNNN